MCPCDCDIIIFYKKCQHPIPVGACNKFALGLNMCTADPIEPVKFDLRGEQLIWLGCMKSRIASSSSVRKT